jgi:hypothetical protein
MPKADVTYNTIGFVGTVGTNATFTLYLDNEKTGAKTYHVYFKQLGGTGKLTLTTGKSGASNLVMNAGTYVAIIYVDENGNITMAGATATSLIEAGNNQPLTSDGLATSNAMPVNSVTSGNLHSVTSNAVYEALKYKDDWLRGQVVLTDKFFEGYRLKNYWNSVLNSSDYEVSFTLPEVPINIIELRVIAQDGANNVIRDGYSDGGYVLRCAYIVSNNRVRVNWTGWSILNSISMFITYR